MVKAPTHGAAGAVPAVMHYCQRFVPSDDMKSTCQETSLGGLAVNVGSGGGEPTGGESPRGAPLLSQSRRK